MLTLTLILLTFRIWRAPNNASKWYMGFNSAFKGLRYVWAHPAHPVLTPVIPRYVPLIFLYSVSFSFRNILSVWTDRIQNKNLRVLRLEIEVPLIMTPSQTLSGLRQTQGSA
jgi:hypothetical protein